MGSLADLYSFQALVWMCINAAMQRYAIQRPDSDVISTYVVHFDQKLVIKVFTAILSSVRESVWVV
jgi:hypothetical protein